LLGEQSREHLEDTLNPEIGDEPEEKWI